ncbi:MAG: YceI family protein [Candidatus Nanopelagicales bacterium]
MELGPENGTLHLHTGVTGSAAKMGHALTIAVEDWTAVVEVDGDDVTAITASAGLSSIHVLSGKGGVKPITDSDRAKIRGNALGTLHADKHPTATFAASQVTRSGGQLTVVGDLTIAGTARRVSLDVQLSEQPDGVQATCGFVVKQTDFGIKPFSTMMGQLKVADDVRVELAVTARRA